MESDEARNLDLPIKKYMDACWQFADQAKSNKKELEQFISKHFNEYAVAASGGGVDIPESKLTEKRLRKVLERLFKCLVQCTRPNKQGEFEMTRQELIWEKKGFIKHGGNEVVLLDDFLEACAHIQVQEVKVNRAYKKLDGTVVTKVETAYEVVEGSQRPFQATPKQERPINPRMYNEDGTRTNDSMDEAEMVDFLEIN